MIEIVANFGVDILPEEMKTPELLHIIYAHRKKIHAHEEVRNREQQSVMTAEHIYDLIYSITGNLKEANKAQSYFILEESKRERVHE